MVSHRLIVMCVPCTVVSSTSHLNLHSETSWDKHPILLSKLIHDFCKALGSLYCLTTQVVQNIYASLLYLNNFYNSVIICFILRYFYFIWIAFIMFTGHYTELCSHFLPFLHCRMAKKGENLPNLSNKNYISKQVTCLWYLYRQNGWKSVSGNEEPETRSHWGQARYVCHMFRQNVKGSKKAFLWPNLSIQCGMLEWT